MKHRNTKCRHGEWRCNTCTPSRPIRRERARKREKARAERRRKNEREM